MMFWRGCLQILILLGIFYGGLYWIYLQLDLTDEPEEEVPNHLGTSLSYYSDLIKDDPTDPINYLERGKILAEQFQDYARAIEDFTYAIDLDESFVDAYFERSLSREKLNDISGSIEDYDKVLTFDPENVYALGNRAIMKHELGDYLGAISDYTETITLDPSYEDAYYGRGLSRSVSGDTTGALQDYALTIGLNDQYKEAYINRAVINLQLGFSSLALSDYMILLSIEPKSFDGLTGAAFIYWELDSLEQSKSYYDLLTREYPEEPDAFHFLGRILNRQNQHQEAYNYLTKAIVMNGSDYDSYVQRGLSSLYLGDTINACLDWVEANNNGSEASGDYLSQYCKR